MMPRFTYTALNAQHKTVTNTVELADRASVVASLNKQNLKPIAIKEEVKTKMSFNIPLLKQKVKNKDLVIFTRQLSTMVNAGVPLMRAITTLAEQTENRKFKNVLDEVTKSIQGGISLGDALSKHPDTFNDVYVNMVRAGEAGGILDDILKRLATQQEKAESMRKKIKGAMTYPTVLVVIMTIAFFVLMIFVIPQIGKIITDLGGPDAELPLITQIMLGISGFMVNFWWLIIGAGITGFILFSRYIKTESGKHRFHFFLINMPIIGPIIKKVSVARFARTFASLLGAGVSVLESLRVTGQAIGNEIYKEELNKAATEVENGRQLSQSLTGNKLFPQIVAQMLAVGEETGQTDTILVKVADFYEEEVDTMIGSISSIIEPVMIVLMGSMVGLIAVSVLGPISSISENIK